MSSGKDPDRAEQEFLALLGTIEVVDLDRDVMKRFARIRGYLRTTGQIVGDPDILIAATAIHHGMTLVTRNRRHYDRIPDLRVYEEPTTATPSS